MEGTIIAAALPSPWPPPAAVELFAKEQVSGGVILTADSRGCFIVELKKHGQAPEIHTFGPLDAAGASTVVLSLTWSSAGVDLHVNGISIPREATGGEPVRLPAQENSPFPIGPVMPSLDPSAGASADECFFLATLADIDQKVIAGDRYSLIRASGLLRQLLLDGLLHAANRSHRVRIEFSVVDFTKRPPREPETHWLFLDPSPFAGVQQVTCTLDQFLAAPCLRWNGADASVKDLIRACANAKGGVHLGKAKVAEEQVLLDWDEVCSVMGDEPSLQALAGVCRVTLVGLQGLAEAVMTGGSPTSR